MRAPNTLAVDPTNVEQARAWDGAEGDYWAEHADWFDHSLAGYDAAFAAAARIGPGDQVLDVGCGTGHTTLAAARAAADGGALGVDLSAHMIDVARLLAAREGLPNARLPERRRATARVPARRVRRRRSAGPGHVLRRPAVRVGNLAAALRPGRPLTLLTWQPVAHTRVCSAPSGPQLTAATSCQPRPGAPSPFC